MSEKLNLCNINYLFNVSYEFSRGVILELIVAIGGALEEPQTLPKLLPNQGLYQT